MNLTRHPSHRVALVGVAAAGLLLTGCGSSLGIHPGSAVVVGGDTVSMDKIDTTSTLFCKVYVAQSQKQSASQQSGPLPLGSFRSYAAASLAKRALGQQLADQYAVSRRRATRRALSQYQQALASTPADQRDAAIAVAGADAYLQNVEVAIGQKLTGSTGQTNAELKADLAAWPGRGPGLAQPAPHVRRPGLRPRGRRREVLRPEGPDVVPPERAGLAGRPGAARPDLHRGPAHGAGLRLTRGHRGRQQGEPLLDFGDDMRRLRRDCPWKREQTHRSLARYLQEETAETLEAIDSGDDAHLREELGDLLLQVYFHAVIAEESGALHPRRRRARHQRRRCTAATLTSSARTPARRPRCPPPRSTPSGRRSRPREKPRQSAYDGIPAGLPALLLATKILEREPGAAVPRGVRAISATGCSPWSPRRRPPASTPSRPSATPSAAPSHHPESAQRDIEITPSRRKETSKSRRVVI